MINSIIRDDFPILKIEARKKNRKAGADKMLKKKPRLPLEAVKKLRSHPVSSKKGKKGYNRKKKRHEDKKTLKNTAREQIN